MEPATLGFDYGTKAILRIAEDHRCVQLLTDGLLGVTYDFGFSADLLAGAPALILLFRLLWQAEEVFQHFAEWREFTGSGDALGVTFIEHPDDSFTLCIFQEPAVFIKAAIPDELSEDIEVAAGTGVFSMRVPLKSEGYKQFKTAVARSPFVLVAATRSVPPVSQTAISKRTAAFYAESAVPLDSPASLALRTQPEVRADMSSPPWRCDPERLRTRRRAKVRQFFPVTLEQLQHEQRFDSVRSTLIERGYTDWQVKQAICNHNWKRRARSGQNLTAEDEVELVTILSETFEHASLFSVELRLDVDELEQQILADTMQLLGYAGAPVGSPADGQLLLRQRGLLNG